MTKGRHIAALGAAALTMIPAAAGAQGGSGGGGGGSCAALTSDEPGKTINTGKPITQSWTVANCTTATKTINVKVVPDGYHVIAVETGEMAVRCDPQPLPFTAGSLTLQPGERRSLRITVPADPCYAPGQYRVGINFNATARSAGQVVGTAFSAVTIRNRA